MSKIIMISGQQGSGKTTLADRLWDFFYNENTRSGAVRLKFADPLYAANEAIKDAMEPYGIQVADKEGTLLQLLGTEWGRKVKGENVWVDALKRQLSLVEKNQPNAFIIIDDCRFSNEFDAFPDALRIRLKAPEEVRKTRTKSWRENTGHASEQDLMAREKEFELVIDTGENTKEETFQKVIEMIKLKFVD